MERKREREKREREERVVGIMLDQRLREYVLCILCLLICINAPSLSSSLMGYFKGSSNGQCDD